MAIVEVRIDDRLIHGQVSGYWVPQFSVQRILIIDDDIVNDEARKTALKFGCPPSCKLSIFNVEKASDKLKRKIDEGIRVMILCQNPQPLAKLVKSGYMIDHVTVGNMASKQGADHIADNAYVSQEEREAFEYLAKQGIPIFYQIAPNKPAENITEKFK